MAPPIPPTKAPMPSVPGIPKTDSDHFLQTPSFIEKVLWSFYWGGGLGFLSVVCDEMGLV